LDNFYSVVHFDVHAQQVGGGALPRVGQQHRHERGAGDDAHRDADGARRRVALRDVAAGRAHKLGQRVDAGVAQRPRQVHVEADGGAQHADDADVRHKETRADRHLLRGVARELRDVLLAEDAVEERPEEPEREHREEHRLDDVQPDGRRQHVAR
jgi:hypothetical protein